MSDNNSSSFACHVPVQFVESELPTPHWSTAASQEDHDRCAKEQLVM